MKSKNKSQPKFSFSRLFISLLIAQSAGIIGGLATASSVKSWYVTDLIKPSFNPPSWVFGPVWTLLFLLMGISLYLVWNKKNNLFWFWIQFFLNILWSFLFFGFRSPTLAFYEILILWFAIFMTTIKFFQYRKSAGILFLPYLFWVTFASFFNYSVMILN